MVLPSFAEGLPVVIMEAFAGDTPVITTAIAGIPELVDNTCGWVVPPASSKLLANAISSGLAATHEQRFERGRAGRDRVRASHDAAVNAAQLIGYIEGGSA
jgi:glycosyltransferase involved in cell wall biosynthesis